MATLESPSHTPINFPTFNVRLSRETIQAIIAHVLPDQTLISCRQLESGKSFNNRIYFIEVTNLPNHGQQSLVLKVSGHYFGALKVQNEIGSLLLLRRYCPSIPVPKVVAWSEDGSVIQTVDGRTIDMKQNPEDSRGSLSQSFSKHGWILMSRMPGRVLTDADLEGSHGQSLLKEIAGNLATWRTAIPSSDGIGNTRFREPSEQDSDHASSSNALGNQSPSNETGQALTVGGLILCHRYTPASLPTPLAYYTYQATDQQFRLNQFPPLQRLHAKISSDVQRFIDNIPRLSFLQPTPTEAANIETIKFTHLDLSPRNILITDTNNEVPHVTGILDFEFSGFLPAETEFLNLVVSQSDDWSSLQYLTLTQELAKLGCEIPHLPNYAHGEPVCTKESKDWCLCESRGFEGLCILTKVVNNIAPWYVQEGSHTDEELDPVIEAAAEVVRCGIESLSEFLI